MPGSQLRRLDCGGWTAEAGQRHTQEQLDRIAAGSWHLFEGRCLLCIFANLGLGLFLLTLAPNQMGVMQLFLFIILPSVLL